MRGKLAEAISQRPDGKADPHPLAWRARAPDAKRRNQDRRRLPRRAVLRCFGNANGVARQVALRFARLRQGRRPVRAAGRAADRGDRRLPECAGSASRQDRVDCIVKVDQVGDPSKYQRRRGARHHQPARTDDRALRRRRDRALRLFQARASRCRPVPARRRPRPPASSNTAWSRKGINAGYALGGITGSHGRSAQQGPDRHADRHPVVRQRGGAIAGRTRRVIWKISTNEYANPSSKGTYCRPVDVVILQRAGNRPRLQRQRHHRFRRRDARRFRRALRHGRRRQPDHRGGAADPQPHPDRGAPA